MISRRRWMAMCVCVVACLANPRPTAAAVCTWTGNGATVVWSTPLNWDACGGAHALPANGDTLVFPSGALKPTNVNDLVGLQVQVISVEAMGANGVPYAIQGERLTVTSQVLFMGGTPNGGQALLLPLTIAGDVLIDNSGPGPAAAVLGDIDLGTHLTDVSAYTASIVIAGVISGPPTGHLRKLGGFGLALIGANTYEGLTTVVEGNLDVLDSSALGAAFDNLTTGHTVINNGATVNIGAGLTVDESFLALQESVNAAATLRLPTGEATIGGRVRGEVIPFSIEVGDGATLTIPGRIQMAASSLLRKTGAGTLILANGSNNWTGVNFEAGVVRLAESGAVPGQGLMTIGAGAVLDLDGHSQSMGTLLDSAGTIRLGAATLTIRQNAEGTLTGPIEGAGNVVKNGNATLRFGGSTPNTYSGSTTVNQGTLDLSRFANIGFDGVISIRGNLLVTGGVVHWGVSHQVDDGSAVDVVAPGALDLGPTQEIIGSLSGTGNVSFGGSLTVGTNHASTLYAGTFSGGGFFRKVGAGTLTLTGAHTLTGSTDVAGGALIVNGSLGAVTVSRGLIGGSGTVASIVSSALGGIVSPGASPGILTTASAALGAGTVFVVDLNGATAGSGYDQLKATGGVSLFGTTLSATLGFVPAPGTTFTIIEVGSGPPPVGTFNGLPQNAAVLIGGRPFRVSYTGGDGNDVVLTALAVPEISISDVTVTEGDTGSTNATFTVSLSTAPIESVSVQYATVNGSAASPQDFTSHSGTLVFLPGNQSQTITVAVHGDTIVESAETFVVRLANVQGGATIADADGVGTIANDDTQPPPTPTPTALTWYLAEGATGAFFDNDVLIANPTATAAPVTLTFFKEGGGTIVEPRTVAARSRLTIHVDQLAGLENASASVQVTSTDGVPLVVERSMFWDATYYGGHTGAAVDHASPTWYFAEAAQGFFETFVLVTNATTTAADVTLTFLREGEPPVVKTVPVGASSRVTIAAAEFSELANRSFGLIVEATQPVIAERSMYFGTVSTGAGPVRVWSGGHESPGVTEAATHWFHAEGATGGFFDTFILLSNPQDAEAQVTLDFLLEDGATVRVAKTIPAKGRVTVDIEAQDDPRLRAGAISTVVTADRPIVSERSTYWAADASPWGEGHNSFGVTGTGAAWGLAEGRVGGPHQFRTFILLANPQTTPADVTVTYLRETGAPIVKTYSLLPESRFTIGVNSDVPELRDEMFGARIDVTNGVPIVVERSMYWDANGIFFAGGSHAPGTRLPSP